MWRRLQLLLLWLVHACAKMMKNTTKGQIQPPEPQGGEGLLMACNISPSTNVVLYDGSGTGHYSSLWEGEFWKWWSKAEPGIEVVTVMGPQMRIKSGCRLSDYPSVKLYVQPGGDAYQMQNSLKAEGRDNILAFLEKGGAYVGTCAGWFLASSQYRWQGESFKWSNVLGIFPNEVEGSLVDIADYDGSPNYAVTNIATEEGVDLKTVYYGGPTIGWKDTSPTLPKGFQEIANFRQLAKKNPASVIKDKILLMSPHFEAHEEHGLEGLETKDRLANYQWRARQINKLLGTHWAIPNTP